MPDFVEKLDDYLVRYLGYSNYQDYVTRMNLMGDERVLEVGCGGGNLSRFLAKRLAQGKLVCIDNSDYWIEKAKKRLRTFENIEFILEDILRFNGRNYFDAIVVHYVLHDITEKGKMVNVLNRNLKPRGRIYIREPTRKDHGISLRDLEELMCSAGLQRLSLKEDYSFPIRGKICEGVFIK